MPLGLTLSLHLHCKVCDQAIDQSTNNLKSYLSNGFNDPLTVALFLIHAGCCPSCGTVVVYHGQTPDVVLVRYNKLLEERLRERCDEERHSDDTAQGAQEAQEEAT